MLDKICLVHFLNIIFIYNNLIIHRKFIYLLLTIKMVDGKVELRTIIRFLNILCGGALLGIAIFKIVYEIGTL